MHLFFSTPIWSNKIANYKDVNEDLYNYILNLRDQNPEWIKKSNYNGWHSKDFNLNDEIPKKFINAVSTNNPKSAGIWIFFLINVYVPFHWVVFVGLG